MERINVAAPGNKIHEAITGHNKSLISTLDSSIKMYELFLMILKEDKIINK